MWFSDTISTCNTTIAERLAAHSLRGEMLEPCTAGRMDGAGAWQGEPVVVPALEPSRGLDIKIWMVLTLEKRILIQLFIFYLHSKNIHQKVVFVNELLPEHLAFSFSRSSSWEEDLYCSMLKEKKNPRKLFHHFFFCFLTNPYFRINPSHPWSI